MKPAKLALISMGMIVTGLLFLSVSCNKTVFLSIDGDTHPVSTSAWTVGEFIRSINLPLYAGDEFYPPSDKWLLGGETVTINEHQISKSRQMGKPSPYEAQNVAWKYLRQAGVPLFPGDQIIYNGSNTFPDSPLSAAPNYALQLHRKLQVTITINDELRAFDTKATTLGEALWEQGIVIHPYDLMDPPADTLVNAPLKVSLKKAKLIQLILRRNYKDPFPFKTVGEILSQAGLPCKDWITACPIPICLS
jgi:uncharacterized protein YabE (DUF348 family)